MMKPDPLHEIAHVLRLIHLGLRGLCHSILIASVIIGAAIRPELALFILLFVAFIYAVYAIFGGLGHGLGTVIRNARGK